MQANFALSHATFYTSLAVPVTSAAFRHLAEATPNEGNRSTSIDGYGTLFNAG
jgi:hypothetical protein